MIFKNIKGLAKDNNNFRKVIHTGKHSQLVLMSLLPFEDIGSEVHQANDQIIFIVEGKGEAILNGSITHISHDSIIYVSAGTQHNIKNTDTACMKLYTVYAPADHADNTIHKTKADAQKEEAYSPNN